MVTVSHLVKNLIERKPFLEEALSRGVINYGALADSLKPEVEKELRKGVKHSAVMMALRRHADKAGDKLFKTVKFRDDTSITMRSDLTEITILKSTDSADLIRKLYGFIDFRKGDFISIVQGLHEISIITNRKHEKNFLSLINKKDVKNVSKELSSLTMNIPEDSTETIGLFYIVTRALSWENISIIEIVSTWSEMTFIVNTEDAPYAFKVLNKVIKENKS